MCGLDRPFFLDFITTYRTKVANFGEFSVIFPHIIGHSSAQYVWILINYTLKIMYNVSAFMWYLNECNRHNISIHIQGFTNPTLTLWKIQDG